MYGEKSQAMGIIPGCEEAAEGTFDPGSWPRREDGRAIAIDGKTLGGAYDFGKKTPHLSFFSLSVVRLSFVDGFVSFLFIASVWLGFFVRHGRAGIVVEGHQQGEVVGSDVG